MFDQILYYRDLGHFLDPYFINFFYQYYWLTSILIIWSLTWKGLALWRAAELKSKTWFVVILIFNTLGLLEIGYLLATRKSKSQNYEINQ